jgi:hypothetical protein
LALLPGPGHLGGMTYSQQMAQMLKSNISTTQKSFTVELLITYWKTTLYMYFLNKYSTVRLENRCALTKGVPQLKEP